jgi:HlyD family secretion protein
MKIIKQNKRTALLCIVLFLFQAFLPFLLLVSCNKSNRSGYTVLTGPFKQSVIETGELQAVHSSTIGMPRINSIYGYSFKITSLAEHGKNVTKGDPVVIVDPSSVQKYIIDRRESLENEMAIANKLKAQILNSTQDLKAQLRNEEASFKIKKLQFEKSVFESVGIRKVIEIEYQQAEIKLNRIKRNLLLRPKIDSLDLRIQQIKVIQRENELKLAEETLRQMVVTSPLDGVFVIERNSRTGQTTKIGDEVYIGNTVARIPDIRTIKVKGFVLENDISRIKKGLDVIVRMDALPNVPFYGKLTYVSMICIPNQDGKKIFQTEVLITGTDLRLKPGMTVKCEYITYKGENEIYVPNNCLREESKHYYCFVRKRGKIKKTEVTTGLSNNTFTIVSGDIRPGQELILPENTLTKQ